MTSSALMSLTAADSSILTDSRSFSLFALLSDNTPVAIPGNELKKRVSGINPEVLVYRVTSIALPTNAFVDWYSLQAESVAYDNDGWMDIVNSPTVLRVPDDRLKEIEINAKVSFSGGLGAGEDNVFRSVFIRYTSVTSNKYGTAFPVTFNGSYSNSYLFGKDSVIQDGDECSITLKSGRIYIESGDQFTLGITASNVTNTPYATECIWGVNGLQYNPTRTL